MLLDYARAPRDPSTIVIESTLAEWLRAYVQWKVQTGLISQAGERLLRTGLP